MYVRFFQYSLFLIPFKIVFLLELFSLFFLIISDFISFLFRILINLVLGSYMDSSFNIAYF